MKYFSINELCNSETAKKKGIPNIPTDEVKKHLTELVDNLLDPLREAWGTPIKITSGYRCTALNKAIGGSTTSAHNSGYAVDMVPANGKITEFKSFVMTWLKKNNLKFDQYINEFSGASQWVHLSIKNNSGAQRKQYMLYKNGKYSYIN